MISSASGMNLTWYGYRHPEPMTRLTRSGHPTMTQIADSVGGISPEPSAVIAFPQLSGVIPVKRCDAHGLL